MRLKITLDTNKYIVSIKEISSKIEKFIEEARIIMAIQMLTYMNTGSPNEPIKPPIRWGVLRGSSSVFVGDKLAGMSLGTKEKGSPALSYQGSKEEITVVYNTSYAAKMHEWNGGWGAYTLQDGNAGAKWVEKHLTADAPLLLAIFEKELVKRLK